MKGVIIAVLALLVIGGGGAGAYFFLQPKDANAETVAEAEKPKDKSQVAYVEMDPFILSVVGKSQAHQVISIAVALEVSDPLNVQKVEQKRPKLTDAFLDRDVRRVR